MKKIFVMGMLMLSVLACNEKGGSASVELKSEDDKTFYAMGVMLGSNLQRLELTDHELGALYKGVIAAAKSAEPEVDMAIYQPKIQQMFKARMEAVSKKQKESGKKFLDDYVAKSGGKAKKTESGLVYEVIKEGTGKMPTATDTVEVHYHGTLTNGEVFDSSVDRGKTISFPLNRVIPGWTEGVQLMVVGDKFTFIIPSDLAYGPSGIPQAGIGPNATLIFEVELLEIK